MEKLDNKISLWLREYLIPHLAELFDEECSGGGGNGSRTKENNCKVTRPKGSFYLSDLFFCSIRFPGQERHVLVKLPAQDPIVSSTQNYEQLFANEILFYREMANRESSEYPKCYLAASDATFKRVIVLEDVRGHGYFTSVKKVDISEDYVIAGLRAIARFHANSYTIKVKDPERFYGIVEKIVNIRYDENRICEMHKESLNLRITRVSKALKDTGFDPRFTEKVSDLFEDSFANVMMKCAKPVEPLATIVHGDCTINNILFREVKKDGHEILEAMLIDFALMMYSSPATDVATFLYMSCSREVIRDQARGFLKAYHDTLSECLKNNEIWDPMKYSYEAFWKDYKERAIFGYMIATFFVSMMTEYEKDNGILLQLNHDQLHQINLTGGGEAVTNKLIDMLIDLRDNGFLDDYIDSTS